MGVSSRPPISSTPVKRLPLAQSHVQQKWPNVQKKSYLSFGVTCECCLPYIANIKAFIAKLTSRTLGIRFGFNWSLVSHEILNVHLAVIIHNFSSSIISANVS